MRTSHSVHTFCLLLTVLLVTACQPIRPDRDPGAAAERKEAAEPAATATPEPPAALLTLQPASTGELRTAAEVFTAVSPAVAFVETPLGTGSGILIQEGFVLTNAHVVWPYSEVRLVFPDGSEHAGAPVVGWDLIADLALVGPIETEIQPLPMTDAGSVEIGSDVYLIGYPAEEEAFPQPAITTGILSRLRAWETIDYSFFQVDAPTITGQSGGVMVTGEGDVVGISTFIFSGFGLAGSFADALPRLNTILGHDLGVTIDNRSFPRGDGQTRVEDSLRDENDSRIYILQEEPGAEVEISVQGVGRPQLSARSFGRWTDVAGTEMRDPETLQATLEFSIENREPHIVKVHQSSENRNSFVLNSSHPLVEFPDPDDGRVLAAGQSYLGAVDLPEDLDFFRLELKAGERIRIDVDSIAIDAHIALVFEGDTLEELVTDDDGGGGFFGENSRIVYEAPRDGAYLVVVWDYSDARVGSYFINVSVPAQGADLTEKAYSHSLLPTGYGKMSWYESPEHNFAILEPVDWGAASEEECPATACYASSSATYMLLDMPIRQLPRSDRTREGYIALLSEGLESRPGAKRLSAETVTTAQGLEADRLDFLVGAGGRTRTVVFAYVDEPSEAVLVLIIGVHASQYSQVESLVDMFVDSFRLWESDDREDSAVFHLDEGRRLIAERAYAQALAAYARSIELDPELVQAYRARSYLLDSLGRYEEALRDTETILALDPEDVSLLAGRATVLWSMGRVEDALADMDRIIEMEDPPIAENFNLRSLMLVDIGAYERALADIERTIAINDGELLPHIQDSRGYIYLRMGQLEKARADFEEILGQDLRFAYALLGAGIAYGRLGEEEMAVALIGEAMEQLEEQRLSLEFPNPQMASLLQMAEEFWDGATEPGE